MRSQLLIECDFRDELDQECGRRYYLPYCRQGDEKRIQIVIEFAICPRGHMRNAISFKKYINSRKCVDCHVPHELQTIVRKNRCAACYLRWYRANKKVADIVKPILVRDIIKR